MSSSIYVQEMFNMGKTNSTITKFFSIGFVAPITIGLLIHRAGGVKRSGGRRLGGHTPRGGLICRFGCRFGSFVVFLSALEVLVNA